MPSVPAPSPARCRLTGVAALVLVVAAGCGPRSPATAVATGSVTYDGRPVANGTIAFLPVDGKGPTSGGIVAAGVYRVEGLVPGPKIVRIEAFATEAAFPRSRGEMEQRSRAAGQGGRRAAPPDDAGSLVPPDAEGNNAEVTIAAGTQRLDLHLAPKKAR